MISLFSLFIPVAHAVKLETLGTSGLGVSGMWSTITSTLPYTSVGTSGPSFFALKVLSYVSNIISACAIVVIVYGGNKIVFQGEEGATEGKNIIMYAIIGLILGMVSSAIINYVSGTVANDLLNVFAP